MEYNKLRIQDATVPQFVSRCVGDRRRTQPLPWIDFTSRVLPGNRREAVQGGAGFAGLQNLFSRCSFRKLRIPKELRMRFVAATSPEAAESLFMSQKCRF